MVARKQINPKYECFFNILSNCLFYTLLHSSSFTFTLLQTLFILGNQHNTSKLQTYNYTPPTTNQSSSTVGLYANITTLKQESNSVITTQSSVHTTTICKYFDKQIITHSHKDNQYTTRGNVNSKILCHRWQSMEKEYIACMCVIDHFMRIILVNNNAAI